MDAPKSIGARFVLLFGCVVLIGIMTLKIPTPLRVAVVLEWLDPVLLCAAGIAALANYVRAPEKNSVEAR